MRDDEWRNMWDDSDAVTMIIYACEMRWKTCEKAGCNKCKRWKGLGDAYGMQLLADWIHISVWKKRTKNMKFLTNP